MEKYLELLKLVEDARADAEKFFLKGNDAAGTRLRKAMLAAGKSIKAVRNKVTEVRDLRNM